MPGRTVAIVETDDSDDAAKGRRATGARIAPETASIADGILGRCADKRARRVVDSDAEYLRLGPRPESRITLRYLFPFFDLFGSFRSLGSRSGTGRSDMCSCEKGENSSDHAPHARLVFRARSETM